MRRNNTITPGGMGDPVAQNIRSQQNRDAMPTPEEAKRDHQKRLAKKGCEVCGCDDPEKLSLVRVQHIMCENGQIPERPFDEKVFCDEHRRSPKQLKRAKIIQRGRKKEADCIAIYDCGHVTYIDGYRQPPTTDAYHLCRGGIRANLTDTIFLDN